MTETLATDTNARRKDIEDEMERISIELQELAETNKVLIKKLQTLCSDKPIENNTQQICPGCSCERKSDPHSKALEFRIHVLQENEKGRQQRIKLLNRTFIDLIGKFDNLLLRAGLHAQDPSDPKDTKTGILSSHSAPDSHSDGLVDGHSDGLVDGHSDGLVVSHSDGLVDGHSDGLVDGHSDGLVDGHNDGLVDGHSDGLVDGHSDGLVDSHSDGLVVSHSDGLVSHSDRLVSHSDGPVSHSDGLIDSHSDQLVDSATSLPTKGKTIVITSQGNDKSTRNPALENSLNSVPVPNITCYGDDGDSVDGDQDGISIGYEKPRILPRANENKTSRLTLQNPNFGPPQGKSTPRKDSMETQQVDTAQDQCPELIPKQTRTILVPGIPELYWAELAKSEVAAASKTRVGKISTVLCLDISSSMRENKAWYQATTFIKHFIAGMEHSLQEDDINEESVALCVFGHEVKIVQHLTNQFSLVTNALDCLKVGGPSPLFGGTLMSFAGLMDHSSCQANDIKVFARIILISDGKISSKEILAGPDSTYGNQTEESDILDAVKNIAEKEIRLHCVPVGNANKPFLDKLASTAHGTVYPYTAGRKVAKKLANTLHAGAVLKQLKMLNSLPEPGDLDDSRSFAEIIKPANFMARMLVEGLLGAVCSSEEEQEEIYSIAKEAVKEKLFDNEDSNKSFEKYHVEIPTANLPPIGSRVRRGPDWDKGNQDGNGPGTVVGHNLNHRNVYVTWDHDNSVDSYRYGDSGKYDILLVEEPRVLKEDEMIKVGCLVKRGSDWIYDDQDGGPGAKGVVLRVLDDGRVIIRWPDRNKAYYRFGADGCFDLEICTPQFGGQGHTLRDQASAASTAPSSKEQNIFSGNQSRQNVGTMNKNLTNKNKTSKVRTIFS